jgi:hypothetical protein
VGKKPACQLGWLEGSGHHAVLSQNTYKKAGMSPLKKLMLALPADTAAEGVQQHHVNQSATTRICLFLPHNDSRAQLGDQV